MGVKPREIRVHIEALVLEGFSSADRLRIGAAVERELGRLLAESGLPAGGAERLARDVVDAGSFAREHLGTPSSVGAQVAGAVYRGLGR